MNLWVSKADQTTNSQNT